MATGFSSFGTTTYVPGVFSHVSVENDLANVVPSPRNILVVGEATDGAPFGDVDMSTNYFTDMASVVAAYGSGPVVDACSQLFASQPNAAFTGSVGRVYVAKTNQSVRASHAISSPSNYGTIYYSKYGANGNFVRCQIKDGVTEVKPALSFQYIPSITNRAVLTHVNGINALSGTTTMDITALAASITTWDSNANPHATIACTYVDVVAGDLSVAVSNDVITISTSTAWTNTPVAGSTLIIPTASGIVGSANKNTGVYVITAATSSTITASKVKSFDAGGTAEVAYVAPESVAGPVTPGGSQSAWGTAEFMVFTAMTVSVDDTTASGAGSTLELAVASQAITGAGDFVKWNSLAAIISATTSGVASISASALGSDLTIALTDGTWSSTPAAGDSLRIPDGSLIAGTSDTNVGMYVVKSATASTIVANKCNGTAIGSVSSVFLNGSTTPFYHAAGFVSTSLAGIINASTAERAVEIEANQTKTGEVFSVDHIGGDIVLQLSYYHATATACSVSISNARKMTLTPVGGSLTATVINMNSYSTLKDLVDYINTLSGFEAAIANTKWNAFPTTILDPVQSLGILAAGSATAPGAARIKADFYQFEQFFVDEASFLSFEKGSIVFASGLPVAEGAAYYLAGGTLGATTNTNVTNALSAALLLPVRQVLPCFSRDAQYDISEGFTDSSSTYTIEGINLAVSGHVSTASSDVNRHERIGLLSFHGSFQDAKDAAVGIFSHRCSMAFQQTKTTDASGNVKWFLPWMLQACVAAGRSQAILGTSMLRKNFRLTEARHIGNLATTSTAWARDFDMDDTSGDVTDAIKAGLLVLGLSAGALKMVSPDATTRSGVNDPQGWFYERTNVIFVLDEILATARDTLENFIGSRTTDVSPTAAASAVDAVVQGFVSSGALVGALPSTIVNGGNYYAVTVRVKPAEALEFISLNAVVTRTL